MSATQLSGDDLAERESVVPTSDSGGAPEPTSWGLGLLTRRGAFVVLFAVALAYTGISTFSAEVSAVVTPFVLGIALCLFPLFWNRAQDPFEPASFSGMYTGLGLMASFVTVVEAGKVNLVYLPEISQRAKEELAATVVWSYVIAQAAYLVGYYIPYRRGPRKAALAGLSWSSGRLLFASAVCMAIALPVYAWFQARVGSDLMDVTQLSKGKAVWRDDPTQTWILRGMMLMYLPAMLALAVAIEKRHALAVIACSALIVVEGILVLRAGQRGLTLIFFVTCVAIVHYMWRRIPTSLIVAAAFVGIVVSNVLVQYRIKESEDVRIAPLREQVSAVQQLQAHEGDRNRLSTLGVIYYYFPEKQEFLLGQSWFGLIALPIPRWIWADKAKSFVWRDTNIVPELVGAPVPTPFHGVLYANFSWFGVVLGMLGWGLFHRRLYEWTMAAHGDKSVIVLYANTLFIFGPTLFAFSFLTQFMVPLAAIIVFVGYRRRSALSPLASVGQR